MFVAVGGLFVEGLIMRAATHAVCRMPFLIVRFHFYFSHAHSVHVGSADGFARLLLRVRERASERRGVWVGGSRGERGPWSKFVTQVGEGHLVEGVTLPVYGRGVGEGIESEGVREGVC